MGLWKKLLSWIAGEEAEQRPRQAPASARQTTQPLGKGRVRDGYAAGSGGTMGVLEQGISTPPALAPKSFQREPVAKHPSSPRVVTIGLDFGTHSTKVVIRPRGEETARLLQIDTATAGYPSFASPSLVRVSDGKTYFGSTAVKTSGGTLFRSLKVQLLPTLDDTSAHCDYPAGLTPDLLIAWYLSWILSGVEDTIATIYPDSAPRIALNVAAPMSHIEDPVLKARYLQIVHASWESVFGNQPSPARQGDSVSQLRGRFGVWLAADVPGIETRTYGVLPETVAPIVSLAQDPRMAPGMYMIVDMGAGTTELSVNYVAEPGADQRVLCYADQSILLGGDNFEWIEGHHKEKDDLGDRKRKLVHRLLKSFGFTWGTGYRKDGQSRVLRERWKDFRVILAGGATHREEIQRAIKDALPLRPYPVGENRYRVGRHSPIGIEFGQDSSRGAASLLAVAHGLSIPRQQWPLYFMPSEVETMEVPELAEQPLGYWYLER